MDRRLLQELVWPAAAGNVAWALLTLVTSNLGNSELTGNEWARILTLVLVSFYLAKDWKYSYDIKEIEVSVWYNIADFIHVVSIVVFAIAVEMPLSEQNMAWILGGVFVLTAVGNLLGVWDLQPPPDSNWKERFLMTGCNLVGIIVLCIGKAAPIDPLEWSLATAIAMVLISRGIVENGY